MQLDTLNFNQCSC